jgi:hypothetical protein
VNTLEHSPAALVERTSSKLASAQPVTYPLDGVERSVSTPRGEALRVCSEVDGGVTIVTRLNAATFIDRRRVLPPHGDELERTIRIERPGEPPLHLHRLLVRRPESCAAVPWDIVGGGNVGVRAMCVRGGGSSAASDDAPPGVVADDVDPAPRELGWRRCLTDAKVVAGACSVTVAALAAFVCAR